MYMYQVVKKKWWFEQGLIPGPSAFRVYTLPAGLPSNMFDSLLIYCHTLVPGYIHSYWLLKFIADLVFFHIYFEVFQGLKIVETKWFFCSEGNKVCKSHGILVTEQKQSVTNRQMETFFWCLFKSSTPEFSWVFSKHTAMHIIT